MDTLLIYDVDDLNKSSLPSSIKMKQNRFTVALADQVNVSSQHFLRRCLLLGPIIVVSKLNHLFFLLRVSCHDGRRSNSCFRCFQKLYEDVVTVVK